jgi:RNA polymerase sigma-70 factor (ECF subfamily)
MPTKDDVHSELTDAQLVSIAKRGDRDSFDELIRRHRRRCLSLATSILRDSSEAEEETQNACWKAFEHLNQFQGEAEFLAWLLRIVENQCLMLIRRKRRAQFVHLDERDSERGNDSMQLSASEADPEGEFGNSEVLQVLRTEIRRIPPLLRNVIVMCDVEEMPMSDLAVRLGITVAAAKSRLLRARVELRRRMMRHCTRTGASTLMMRSAVPPVRVFHLMASR